jgi:hypothetical protein
MDRRAEMVQLATQLLSEQINPVRIVSLSDQDGEPQGEFISNQQRFVFKFTRDGTVTYKPKTQRAREDSSADVADLQRRLQRLRSGIGEVRASGR